MASRNVRTCDLTKLKIMNPRYRRVVQTFTVALFLAYFTVLAYQSLSRGALVNQEVNKPGVTVYDRYRGWIVSSHRTGFTVRWFLWKLKRFWAFGIVCVGRNPKPVFQKCSTVFVS